MKAKLNQCKRCGKTYNLNETGTNDNYCCTCNEKRINDFRKKDSLRKKDSRDERISNNLEKLAEIEE